MLERDADTLQINIRGRIKRHSPGLRDRCPPHLSQQLSPAFKLARPALPTSPDGSRPASRSQQPDRRHQRREEAAAPGGGGGAAEALLKGYERYPTHPVLGISEDPFDEDYFSNFDVGLDLEEEGYRVLASKIIVDEVESEDHQIAISPR